MMCDLCEEYGWDPDECPEDLAEQSLAEMQRIGLVETDIEFENPHG